ncbi:MAG: phosphoribosylaminoimidazolesuccinocarboxamide synthase [Candidatus Fimadaptatus sp.]|jgi:phosphoribosylaminoimidazole-succinocarboxamide synthase
MDIREQLYEGKAKRVYATDDPKLVVVAYKDDATAFNGLKKGTITGKGVVNNRMSNLLFKYLADNGIPTHFVEELDERRTVVKHVSIVPLEVIVRNIAAGSFSKRFGVEEGTDLANPTIEFSYKNDDLGDPMINTSQALALRLGTAEQIETIRTMALRVNELLKDYFLKRDLILVDYKLEFGLFDGEVILADEISPDTCRLWDVHTREKLDKDRFRRDMGGVEDAYSEVYHRMGLDK